MIGKSRDVDLNNTPKNEFEELARQFYPKIYRWALVITGSPDDADDITQETVIRAYRHFGTFRGESSLSTWLYRITRNVAFEMVKRRAGRRKERERIMGDEVLEALNPTLPASDADRGELLEIVKSFFRELSERQRELFDLVDLQGYGPAEAAAMLEIDAATARTHLLRARRAIRSRIVERYPEFGEDFK